MIAATTTRFLFILFMIFSEGFGSLIISRPAVKGKNALLTCYLQNTLATTVKWIHDDHIEGICYNTGECYNRTNSRYTFQRHLDQSTLSISDSTYSFDQGTWSCEVDEKWKFSKELVVYSLPSAFDFENPPPSGSRVPESGVLLEAKAVCVFPKFPESGDIILQYKIEGDSAYNNFHRPGRKMEMLYSHGNEHNCLQHEFILVSRIKVEKDDFRINSAFRFFFKYDEVENPTLSKSSIALIFSEKPCDSNPCKNNGTCQDEPDQEFYCYCEPRYTGLYCTEKVDPCDLKPCKNGGTCHGNIAAFTWTCTCPVTNTGLTCEIALSTSSASSTMKRISSDWIHVPYSLWLLVVVLLYMGNNSKILVSTVILICVVQQYSCLTHEGIIPLRIISYPKEGEKGILECPIYAITNTVDVQWICNGRKILSCKIPPQTCESNSRYFANINKNSSLLTIRNASYERDDGNWSCIANNLTSSSPFYVYSSLQDFRLTTKIDPFVDKDGKELSASLECVYPPDFENLVLQYSIKRVHHFNNFTRRSIKLEFIKHPMTSCKKHEYKLTASIRLQCDDFDNLDVSFKFVYFAFNGEKASTRETGYINFPGRLKCRENENAAPCGQKNDSLQIQTDSHAHTPCTVFSTLFAITFLCLVTVIIGILWRKHRQEGQDDTMGSNHQGMSPLIDENNVGSVPQEMSDEA